MKIRLVDTIFIAIGVIIGIILSLQIRANPVKLGSSPVDQIETQRALLTTFSLEQEDLKKKLDAVNIKLKEAQDVIARRSSPKTLQTLEHLKQITGLTAVVGNGVKITLNDNTSVTRIEFSNINENFVQATDLRDLINALFIKGAKAISVNGKRILPTTSIQSVFDNILVGDFKISPPFIVEAVGNTDSLKDAVQIMQNRKIRIFIDYDVALNINPAGIGKSSQFISLSSP